MFGMTKHLSSDLFHSCKWHIRKFLWQGLHVLAWQSGAVDREIETFHFPQLVTGEAGCG
jgi:hypothetical protein